jgi:hypothetical protein
MTSKILKASGEITVKMGNVILDAQQQCEEFQRSRSLPSSSYCINTAALNAISHPLISSCCPQMVVA